MSDEPIQNNELEEEGAPAWVVTFGDLMSLLLCFFVLMLSFSEIDRQFYKEVAGSLSKAFGVQRKTPAFESPKGQKIIAREFDQDIIPSHKREEILATQEREAVGKELKKEVETRFQDMKNLIQVDVDKNKVRIRLMGGTAFDSGKAEIRQQMIPLLKKIGSVLGETKGDIVISGHTDNVPVTGGQYKSNLRLSAARSASVAEFLIHRTSVNPRRIATMGFGKYRPLESNDTPEGREKNRRVEIVLTSLPSPIPEIKKDLITINPDK